jgi:transcription-repair coupling factor (superfamily II helicase)
VERLRGQEPVLEPEPELSFDVPGYIPEDYVEDPGLRLSLYKKMASATDEVEVEEAVAEMRDRFGPLPDEVVKLGRIMGLKVLVRRLRAHGLEASAKRIQVHLSTSTPIDPARVRDFVEASGGATRLTPEMKIVHKFDDLGGDTLARARAFLESLLGLVEEVAQGGESTRVPAS